MANAVGTFKTVSTIKYTLSVRPKGVPYYRDGLVWFRAGKPLVYSDAGHDALMRAVDRIVNNLRAMSGGSK